VIDSNTIYRSSPYFRDLIFAALVHGSFTDRGVGGSNLNSRLPQPCLSNTILPAAIVGKMKFKVTNWPEYEAGLRKRGGLTLWLTPEALVGWAAPRRKTRGGQPRYSDLAIETALTRGLVFGLRLRQAEGLLGSLLQLMGLTLAVPDHTTLSRRAKTWRSPNSRSDRQGPPRGPVHVLVDSSGLKIYGAGQWLEEKHGAKTRRGWRKLHLALDADSGEIIAHTMTDQDTGDASQVGPLLDQIDGDNSFRPDLLRYPWPT
jgi:hypothetical protein